MATVSHELRTPLSLIRGYTETLLHLELSPEEQRAYLERIDEVTERLSSLVGQILDVTHLQADPLILERAPVLFASLASRLRGDLETSGRAERLVIELPDDLPPLEVDGPRVGQILENLVGNAFKYGPADGRVTIGARPSTESGWSITVDDEGRRHPGHGTSARHRTVPSGVERPRVAHPGHRASACSSAAASSRPTVAACASTIGPTGGPGPGSRSRCRCCVVGGPAGGAGSSARPRRPRPATAARGTDRG